MQFYPRVAIHSLNLDAFGTFTVLTVTAGMALAAGVLFSGISGWCNGLSASILSRSCTARHRRPP